MGLREDKAELVSKLFVLEKDKSAIELKLKYVEGQQKAQAAALKNLQGQLKDTEALLALATQNKVGGKQAVMRKLIGLLLGEGLFRCRTCPRCRAGTNASTGKRGKTESSVAGTCYNFGTSDEEC